MGSRIVLKETTRSSLNSIAISDGQIIYCTDTNEIYRDTGTSRNLLSDFVIKSTDDEITGLLAPLTDKFYYSSGSGKIYRYMNNQMVALNHSNAELKKFNVTIPTTGWTLAVDLSFKNDITVTGLVTPTANDIINMMINSTDDDVIEEYNNIVSVDASTNTLTVSRWTTPSVEVDVIITQLRVYTQISTSSGPTNITFASHAQIAALFD